MISFRGFKKRVTLVRKHGHLFATIHNAYTWKHLHHLNAQSYNDEAKQPIDDRRLTEVYKHDVNSPWEYEKRDGAEWDNMRFQENPYDKNDPTHMALTEHTALHKLKKVAPKSFEALMKHSKMSADLNNDLISAHKDSKVPEFRYKESEKTHNGLQKYFKDLARPTNAPYTVWSGTGDYNPEDAFKNNGGILYSPGYTSTSIHKNIANKFCTSRIQPDGSPEYGSKDDPARTGIHIIRYNLPTGFSRGVYIGHHSTRPDENELLLDKGQTWKLKKHTHYAYADKPVMSASSSINYHPELRDKPYVKTRPDVHVWEVEPA